MLLPDSETFYYQNHRLHQDLSLSPYAQEYRVQMHTSANGSHAEPGYWCTIHNYHLLDRKNCYNNGAQVHSEPSAGSQTQALLHGMHDSLLYSLHQSGYPMPNQNKYY